MKVRFKCQTEYQRSYRSRSVSPQRSAPFAGLHSAHMGVSREPCLQRRKRLNSPHPPPRKSLNEIVIDAQPFKNPAAPPTEPEHPPGPQPTGKPSEKTMDTEKPETSDQFPMKSQQHSSSYSPALVNPQESSTNNHALRRKAGLRLGGQRPDLHKTEYNRQFNLKMAPAAPSPMLTAHRALYTSHSTVPPFKKHPVSMDTEYRRSFQGLAPPTSPRLRKKQEHERHPLFHTHVRKNKNVVDMKSESPGPEVQVHRQQPSPKEMSPDRVASHLKTHRVLTEYESRFRSPLRQIPEEIEATTRHSSQMKELREKALSYRRRAWGTNFSREHLSQLLSEQNVFWEPTETIDSMTEGPQSTRLDLCQVSSAGTGSGRSSCLEALDLASKSSRSSHRASAVDLKDEEINQITKTNITTPQSNQSLMVEDILPMQEQDGCNGEEEGRLPTPELKMMPIQRTHLDLTTPAAGGAMLVGKLKGTDEVIQRSTTSNSNEGTSVHIPVKPREAWTSQHKPTPKPVTPRNSPPLAALPPTAPLHCIQGTLRNADFQHNGELGLRFCERKCATASCGSEEDDRLSVMSCRSAASCTMASAILERAQKRRKNFWGKS